MPLIYICKNPNRIISNKKSVYFKNLTNHLPNVIETSVE